MRLVIANAKPVRASSPPVYCQECGRRTETQEADNPCCCACIAYLAALDAPAYYEPSTYDPGAFIDVDAHLPGQA